MDILTFQPQFKHVIWGGDRIARFKNMPPQGDDVGESWEISPMEGHESVADGGECAGATLNQIVAERGAELMGDRLLRQCGGRFPLLLKIIDAHADLSIQVHPGDELARRRHGSLGKTEAWLSLLADPGAGLLAGFEKPLAPGEFRQRIAAGTLAGALRRLPTRAGSVTFLPAGRVHAICAGNLVMEIQQASDVTYRIFDYGRLDRDGHPRQLHVAQAMEAVDFADCRAMSAQAVATPGREAPVVECDKFAVSLLGVDGGAEVDLGACGSFTILFAVSGDMEVSAPGGGATPMPQGRSALVPASARALRATGHGTLAAIRVP